MKKELRFISTRLALAIQLESKRWIKLGAFHKSVTIAKCWKMRKKIYFCDFRLKKQQKNSTEILKQTKNEWYKLIKYSFLHTNAGCKFPHTFALFLKVRLSQNGFMKSSIFQNMNQKIWRILPLIFCSFLGASWKLFWAFLGLKANVSQENRVLCHVLWQFSIVML